MKLREEWGTCEENEIAPQLPDDDLKEWCASGSCTSVPTYFIFLLLLWQIPQLSSITFCDSIPAILLTS
jgi:hypothetical protein